MEPIRVALVGLSTTNPGSWASFAHIPYLQSENGKKHYRLDALLNSSKEAAESAKVTYNLTNVKAYGDPKSLAADPDIDLVVISSSIETHFSVLESTINAGKAVFVEWPLTHSLETSLKLINDKQVPNSIMGLQSRFSPVFLQVKELLNSGVIGKVFNSEVKSHSIYFPRDQIHEMARKMTKRETGVSMLGIAGGHMLDFVHDVLGDWDAMHVHGQIQRPELIVIGTNELVTSDNPDYISIHGTLKNTRNITVPGALLTITFRHGQPFKNEPGFIWTINGERGELRIKSRGPLLDSDGSYDHPITIEVHDHASDTVEEVGWVWAEWQEELPVRGRSTAELYERFADNHLHLEELSTHVSRIASERCRRSSWRSHDSARN
ncbi:oxidoreductase family protein [Cladochytrium replicatum]|nr:oxidoreductase family protein [Cladochytrium replicatum]